MGRGKSKVSKVKQSTVEAPVVVVTNLDTNAMQKFPIARGQSLKTIKCQYMQAGAVGTFRVARVQSLGTFTLAKPDVLRSVEVVASAEPAAGAAAPAEPPAGDDTTPLAQ